MNLIHSGQVSSINSLKDGTIKLSLELQEMKPEDVGRLYSMRNHLVKFYFTTENILEDVTKDLDKLQIEHEDKSPSKRMRNILYRLYEQDSEGYDDFNLYYNHKMNIWCEKLKDKLV